VTPGLDKIPVYVRDGGIIPMMKTRLHAPKNGETVDLEVRYYGEKPAQYKLYDDDGETYNYEHGDYSWRELKVEVGVDGKLRATISDPVKGKPNTVGTVSWKFMTTTK